MSASPEDLFARLDALGVRARTTRHAPVFTVDEAKTVRGELPGTHCKCLFLKDKKAGLWLIVVPEDRRVDLKRLEKTVGAKGRFSFGKPELLRRALGVVPGAVTPFALINDPDRQVRIVIDREVLERDPVNFHPLTNDATTAISPDGLLTFISGCGHEPLIVDFDTLS